jgi:protein-disulfide isomerase
MSHECEKCGDEFDSKRGLSIHKSQMHSEEEKQENNLEDTDTTEKDNTGREEVNESSQQGITLTAKQFGGLTFATGLFLGLALGVMLGGFSGVQTETVGAPTVDNSGDNQGSPSGSSIVELSSAEYPYGDLEAGVGSGERTYGNITFNLDGEPYIGSPDAGVTAVSYEDFECPFCKRYNEGAYPQIVENFVRTGEVQYFYKNLPLQQIHPWSEPAALASECALNQDAEAFWTFKQGFFSNQEQLGNAYENSNFDASMYRWAEQTGLDTEQFRTCYDNEEEIEEVQQDKQEAGENGAQATPTVLINDQKLEGAQPYSRFESTIQSALQ